MNTIFIDLIDFWDISYEAEKKDSNNNLIGIAQAFEKASKLLLEINTLLNEKNLDANVYTDNNVIRLQIKANKEIIEKLRYHKILNSYCKKFFDHDEDNFNADSDYNSS